MRKIEQIGQFKRDYRRVAVGRHRASLDTLLSALLPLARDRCDVAREAISTTHGLANGVTIATVIGSQTWC